MDQFNFNNFPETNFNEVNLSWMLEIMTQFKEDLESGQFVGPQGPQGPQGVPGPAGDGLTEEVKQALLQLARKVAYIDDQGPIYYQDLYDALYGTTPSELVSISAVYTQSGPVYDTDNLYSLADDLVVTASYSDGSTAVIPMADYTLSGSLTVGTSTITVSYSGMTDTFQVTVTASAVTLVSIAASFNQGSAVIYESDSLDTLKQYLTVTASYSDSTTATIPSTDYTLSGTLTEGISTITVSYRGEMDTFQVTVTADPVPVTLDSISAAFNQGSAVIYDSASLDSLKQYLTVTATYSDSTTATIPSADYTLSGTLTAGTSTITVSYQGQTDTFQVTVTSSAGLLYNWDFKTSLTDTVAGQTATLGGNATRTSAGLVFSEALDNVLCGTNVIARNRTIEIKFGTMDAQFDSTSVNGIFFWINQTPTHGFGWAQNRNAFGGYWNTAWNTLSGISDLNYFSGSTFKMTITSAGYPTYYKDGVRVGGGSANGYTVQTADTALLLGSTTSTYPAFYNMIIEAVRIYEGVV